MSEYPVKSLDRFGLEYGSLWLWELVQSSQSPLQRCIGPWIRLSQVLHGIQHIFLLCQKTLGLLQDAPCLAGVTNHKMTLFILICPYFRLVNYSNFSR